MALLTSYDQMGDSENSLLLLKTLVKKQPHERLYQRETTIPPGRSQCME